MDYDLTHKDGKPYVMIPFHEYRTMEKDGVFSNTTPNNLPSDLIEALESSKDHPIKTVRKYRGFTQQELAQSAKISRPFLTEIETGKKNGSVQAIKKIAHALDVSVDNLIT